MIWRWCWPRLLVPHRKREGTGRPPLPLPTVAISDPYYRELGGAGESGGEFAVFVRGGKLTRDKGKVRRREGGRKEGGREGGREGWEGGEEGKVNGTVYSVYVHNIGLYSPMSLQ